MKKVNSKLLFASRLGVAVFFLLLSFKSFGVLNGERIRDITQYPDARSVMLVQNLRNGQYAGVCTAVLISDNIGLTAAHCFEHFLPGDNFRVLFGVHQYPPPERIRDGVSYTVHPKFGSKPDMIAFDFSNGQAQVVVDQTKFSRNSTTKLITQDKHYDIAIFSFRGQVPADMRPAKVLDGEIDLSNQSVNVYGAGHSIYIAEKDYNQKQRLSGEFGLLRLGKTEIGPDYLQFPDFYYTNPNSLTKTCEGDSGGPQFLVGASSPTVVGINSAMIVNDLDGRNLNSVCGHTSVVTKIAPLAHWIKKEKAKLLSKLQSN